MYSAEAYLTSEFERRFGGVNNVKQQSAAADNNACDQRCFVGASELASCNMLGILHAQGEQSLHSPGANRQFNCQAARETLANAAPYLFRAAGEACVWQLWACAAQHSSGGTK
jgi:hypothetical protein